MAITLVQKTSNLGTNVTSATATLNSVAAGNTLVIVLGENAGAATLNSITDSSGNTVSTAVTFGTSSVHAGLGVFYVQNTSAGTHTITVTWSAAQYTALYVAEYSGLATSAVLDVASPLTYAASTTITSGSITPTQNGDLLIFAVAQQNSGDTFSAFTNGFTQVDATVTAESPSSTYASLVQTTAAAISAGVTSSTTNGSNCALVAFKASSVVTPTITSVNGGSSIAEGATGVAVVGTNFASGMTSAIAQPGGVSVAQPFTFTNSTSGTFNLTMEPGTGSQLAFTDATYTTNFTVTVSGTPSSNFAITLVPLTGNIFETLASVNTTSAYRITATPDLVVGDQLEASGNATGTAPVPTGLQLNSDGTWQFSSGNTPADFYVRAYDSVNHVWGPWALQSTTVTSSVYRLTVYELSSVTGLVRWVHYIPVQFPTGVSAYEYDRVDPNGAITCKVLASNTGKVAWVDYLPVFVTSDPAAGRWRYDSNGWIPLVQVASG